MATTGHDPLWHSPLGPGINSFSYRAERRIVTEPGTTPRNGMPEHKPYEYRGPDREPTPREIVERLHAEIARRQAGAS